MSSLAGIKRKLEEAGELSTGGGEHAEAPAAKRAALGDGAGSTALVLKAESSSALTVPTSAGIAAHQGTGLESSHMALTGHAGAVQCVKFSPDGKVLASAGKDRSIFLWHVYGETDNFMAMKGHKNAILDLEWSPDGEQLYSASADKTGGVWDAETGARIRTLAGHTKIINALGVAPKGNTLIVTGSDDATVRLWDARSRSCAATFSERFPVLAVAASGEGTVYSAGIDGAVRQWDVRRAAVALTLEGHSEPVSGLALSPDGGSTLLSFAQDGELRAWDVRPFVSGGVAGNRCIKTFHGAVNNFEQHLLRPAWSPEGTVGGRVSVGSADKAVRVWDYETGELMTALGGHKGAALGVAFHPKEAILASSGADKTVFLSEYLNA